MSIKRLLCNDSGQGLVEYALIIAFIAIILVFALNALSSNLIEYYARISNQLP